MMFCALPQVIFATGTACAARAVARRAAVRRRENFFMRLAGECGSGIGCQYFEKKASIKASGL
jgi:hypothetical protein